MPREMAAAFLASNAGRLRAALDALLAKAERGDVLAMRELRAWVGEGWGKVGQAAEQVGQEEQGSGLTREQRATLLAMLEESEKGCSNGREGSQNDGGVAGCRSSR
jgi:hypothetical protein